MGKEKDSYRYRPILFFICAYLFTWIFWIPAIFLPESISPFLMLIGLMAPAVVSTVFVMASGSDALKQDLKNKVFGFYKVKWLNVLWAVIVFAIIIVCSILLSLLFGQSLDQFSFTKDFSFTGVGIAGAFFTITVAAIIEEVGWKGYCELVLGIHDLRSALVLLAFSSHFYSGNVSCRSYGESALCNQFLCECSAYGLCYHMGVPCG